MLTSPSSAHQDLRSGGGLATVGPPPLVSGAEDRSEEVPLRVITRDWPPERRWAWPFPARVRAVSLSATRPGRAGTRQGWAPGEGAGGVGRELGLGGSAHRKTALCVSSPRHTCVRGATGGPFFQPLCSRDPAHGVLAGSSPFCPFPHHLWVPFLGVCLLLCARGWTWFFRPRGFELQRRSSQRPALGVSGRTDIAGLEPAWATGALSPESLLYSWGPGGKERGSPSTEAIATKATGDFGVGGGDRTLPGELLT